MRPPRIAVGVWMIAVIVFAMIFTGVSLYRRSLAVLAAVVNEHDTPLREVEVTYRERAWRIARLPPSQLFPMGVFSPGRSEVGLSYTDGRGKRTETRVVMGVDLGDGFADAAEPMGLVTIRVLPSGPVSVRQL